MLSCVAERHGGPGRGSPVGPLSPELTCPAGTLPNKGSVERWLGACLMPPALLSGKR